MWNPALSLLLASSLLAPPAHAQQAAPFALIQTIWEPNDGRWVQVDESHQVSIDLPPERQDTVSSNDPLPTGALIHTEAARVRLLLPSGEIILVEPYSTCLIQRERSLFHLVGQLYYVLSDAFRVQLAYTTASVEGTRFVTETHPPSPGQAQAAPITLVAVAEGAVHLQDAPDSPPVVLTAQQYSTLSDVEPPAVQTSTLTLHGAFLFWEQAAASDDDPLPLPPGSGLVVPTLPPTSDTYPPPAPPSGARLSAELLWTTGTAILPVYDYGEVLQQGDTYEFQRQDPVAYLHTAYRAGVRLRVHGPHYLHATTGVGLEDSMFFTHTLGYEAASGRWSFGAQALVRSLQVPTWLETDGHLHSDWGSYVGGGATLRYSVPTERRLQLDYLLEASWCGGAVLSFSLTGRIP